MEPRYFECRNTAFRMNFAIMNLNNYLRFAPAILWIIASRPFQIIIKLRRFWVDIECGKIVFLEFILDLRKSTNFFISPMDFIEEPVHIQDINPKIIEFLKGKMEVALEDDKLDTGSWSEGGIDTPADSSFSMMDGLLSTRWRRQRVLSGLWVGMLGYDS